MRQWWKYFQYSNIDFIHTSHGNSFANSLFVDNERHFLTWSFVAQLTQKRIIADVNIGFGSGVESEIEFCFTFVFCKLKCQYHWLEARKDLKKDDFSINTTNR